MPDEIAPQSDTLLRRAVTALGAGRLAEAARLCEQITNGDPHHMAALRTLGLAHIQSGKWTHAAQVIERALSIGGNDAQLLNHHGIVLRMLGRPEQALHSLDTAVALAPDDDATHYNRAGLLEAMGRYDEALAAYTLVLALKPGDFDASLNRGNEYARRGRWDEALADCDGAVRAQPASSSAHYARGRALNGLGRFEDALESFECALAFYAAPAPGAVDLLPDIHLGQAIAQLSLGRYREGWENYEWRWRSSAFTSLRRSFRQPQWDGATAIAGKTILLHAEQGHGDTIQFSRYVPMVASRAAQVVLEVPFALKRLLSDALPEVHVLGHGETLPAFDLHCPLLSLPRACQAASPALAEGAFHVRADEEARRQWEQALGPRVGLRVGLCWSGRPQHKNDERRSVPLRALGPLLAQPHEFVVVQKDIPPRDAATLSDFANLRPLGDRLHDFAETAAVMTLLDLVISVDSAPAHLAGALGRPTWLLLPHVADWRWLRAGEATAWYPGMRLFRQTAPGDWDGVLAAAAAALSTVTRPSPHGA